ncbi:MAG: carboxylating nicotinate-nucleotide diphosphorylase [Pseudomonadota bacterium]
MTSARPAAPTSLVPLPRQIMTDAVERALEEDLGHAGDVTTTACIPANQNMRAEIRVRKPGVIAGIELVLETFRQIDPTINILTPYKDGYFLESDQTILEIEGPARGILTGERVALNFMGHLSGIATLTHQFVQAIKHTQARFTCTRKTTPGLRALEKYAVRCGGGSNHRFGLYDAVMIKDNHIAAAGGIQKAIEQTRSTIPHTMKIEVEVDTLKQLGEALEAGADVVLLDNMTTDDLKSAVTINNHRSILEASGNVTLDTVCAIAETGVDVISSGWITHSAPSLDVGLDVKS